MKTFDQLSEEDKKLAVNYFQVNILMEIAQGAIRFQDLSNSNDWQAKIDKIIEANAGKHPILIAKELGDNDAVNKVAYVMAGSHAQMSLYIEETENAVELADVRDMGQHRHHANCNHKTH